MSTRDELRLRVGAILEGEYPREWVAEDVTGEQYSEWYRETADAVLDEIERDHVILPRVDPRVGLMVGKNAEYLLDGPALYNPSGRGRVRYRP